MRALILSCNTGGGHNSCARAIKEVFEENGDVCHIADTLSFVSDGFSKFMEWGHATVYRKFPGLFKWGYEYSERHPAVFHNDSRVYKLLTRGTEKLSQFIKEGNYNVIICVHVFSSLILTEVLNRHHLNVLSCFVATDYTCSPSVEQSNLDYYFIPQESLVFDFEYPNIPREKMVCSGVPIRQEFYRHTDMAEAKKQCGIREDNAHLLMMCGSMGCGPMKSLVHLLSREQGQDYELTVVCGTNKRLYRKLSHKYSGNPNIHIRGYENNVPLLMDSADLYLTKPGGLSVTEAYIKGLPMVCIDAVAGCEEYNRNFFLRMGGAKTGRNVQEIEDICRCLISDFEKLSEMRKALDSKEKRNSAVIIHQTLRGHNT